MVKVQQNAIQGIVRAPEGYIVSTIIQDKRRRGWLFIVDHISDARTNRQAMNKYYDAVNSISGKPRKVRSSLVPTCSYRMKNMYRARAIYFR